MIRIPFFSPREPAVASLYGDIVAAARQPMLYRDHGVADDFEGRFEALALVATLVLRRLKALGAAAHPVGQALVDRLFADLDNGLRLAGTGDLSVGKKVKKMAQGFYGRAEAYTEALREGEESLRAALARNLYAGRLTPGAVPEGLLAEIARLESALQGATLDAMLAGDVMVKA